MKKYKLFIKKRIAWLSVLLLITFGVGVYDQFFASPAIVANPIFSFQAGFSASLCIFAALCIINYNKILHDGEKLRIQYNKANDERLRLVRYKAGVPILLVTSTIMIVVGIIAGYFNETIFLTLILTALIQISVSVIMKFIYLRKL